MRKCRECGLLALVHIDSQKVEACTIGCRTSGSVTSEKGQKFYEATPICSIYEFDLRKEIGQKSSHGEILEILTNERPCEAFIKWNPALSPKEHLDMQLIQEQREWQRLRDKDDRDWRDRQAERDRQWRKEDQEAAQKEMQAQRYKGWAIAAWTLAASLITWLISINFR